MEWSHDFCLACDRQTIDGETYCSQACRLADLERASSLSPSTSAAFHASTRTRSTPQRTPTSSTSASGFHLPPAVNFAAYKNNEQAGTQRSHAVSQSRSSVGYMESTGAAQASTTASFSTSDQSLTPSSSHSSLSSMSSVAKQGVSTEEVRNELFGYYTAFDQTRDWKRRRTFA